MIRSLLEPRTVRVRLPGESKPEVIDRLIGLLEDHPNVASLEAVRSAVIDRETLLSTGVGFGLGLPHAKTRGVIGITAAFAVTESPIDFDSIDGQPVRLLFLLVGPEGEDSRHIRLLSQISRLMSDPNLRQQLLESDTAEDVLDLFHRAEAQMAAA